MTGLRRFWPWWRWLLTGLSALALALSVYLAWHHLMGRRVFGCGGGGDCEQLLKGPWSAIGGVLPVSGLAAGTYLAMLVASFFVGDGTVAADRRLAFGAMLVLAGAAAGSAVWFSIVQKWIIGAFCPWCMATHAVGVLVAALVMGRGRRVVGPLRAISMVLMGVGLAGVMAFGQVRFAGGPPAFSVGDSQARLPTFDIRAVPLVGSPDAGYVVTLLFDYNCPHCQKIHAMLEEVVRRYDGKLAFVLCPAPLNNQCNPYIAQAVKPFTNSCELAKIALAVWAGDRAAFAEFERWMFSAEPGNAWHGRTPDEARARAIELLGQKKFEAALGDAWVGRYLQMSVGIFGDTIDANANGSAVPKLVFGSRWVTPEPRSADDLVAILNATLGVPRP